MIRKFSEKIPDSTLRKDLMRYKQMAIALGATDTKIVSSKMVVVDERVYIKCMYPKCRNYGTCANCPPYTIRPDHARKIFGKYKWALLIRLEVASNLIAGPRAAETKTYVSPSLKRTEIVSKIEAQAFQDGYHLALGLGGGSCKAYFCPDVECRVLQGKSCRQALKARPAMEAVGLDVFTMAARVGWKIFPIGERTPPSEVPHGSFIGIVFIK